MEKDGYESVTNQQAEWLKRAAFGDAEALFALSDAIIEHAEAGAAPLCDPQPRDFV